VVPAEVLEAVADLPEALRPHGRAGCALASEKSGGERSERLCFGGHHHAPLLADDPAAEAADWTRARGGSARRRAWRSEHGTAEILFQPVRNIFPQLGHFLGRAALRVD